MEQELIYDAEPVRKRPIAVAVVALLNLLFGGVGILMGPISLLSVLTAAPTVPVPDANTGFNPQNLSFLWLISSYCSSVLLLGAGVGLLKMKPWSWWLTVGCSIYTLVAFILSRALLILMSMGADSFRESYLASLVIGTGLLCLSGFINPLISLFVLLPEPVRQAFRHQVSPNRGKQEPTVSQHSPADSIGSWLVYGPSLPPYQRSEARGMDGGWRWAVWLAPTSFGLLLFAMVLPLASFDKDDLPWIWMGTLALLGGLLVLSGALFEWHWFFNNRSARGVRYWAGDRGSRWFYLAISCILLAFGILMIGFTSMPVMSGKNPLAGLIDQSASKQTAGTSQRRRVRRSALLGGTGGSPFERYDQGDRPLVGLRCKLGNWGNQSVVTAVDPIFDPQVDTTEGVVVSKPGYRIGQLQVDSNEFVNAIRVIFVPLNDAPVEPLESYSSEWIGQPLNPESAPLIGNDREIPVGVFGRQGLVTDAIGLIYRAREGPEPIDESQQQDQP